MPPTYGKKNARLKRAPALLLPLAVFALGSAVARAEEMPFDLSAADVSYDVSNSKVVATGGESGQVMVTGKDGTVKADKMVYDTSTGSLVAEGNVLYTDASSNTLALEKMNITGDMKNGSMEKLKLRVPAIGEVASAKEANISGTTYTLKDVVYSPCKECAGSERPWSISADTMTYDKAAGDVTYRSAVMDVYGVPVMYLPWFRHPLGPRQAKSGMLPPQFGKSTTLGENTTLAGYINSPNENADYTLRTRLMSKRGAQFQAERRQVGLDSDSEIRASYLNDIGAGPGVAHQRNSLSVIAEKDLTESRRLGINGEIASDDTYLSQFFNRHDPYLASTAYGEDTSDHHYAALSVTRFQDLDSRKDPATTAQVLPHLQLDRWYAVDKGGQFDFGADVRSIDRRIGTKSQRMIGDASYKLPEVFADGSKVTFGASGRFDLYNVNSGANDGTISRVLPEGTVTWEKPYVSPGGTHTIAPTVMGAISPRGGNQSNRVPNEDSVSYELDTGNLFEPSRFSGLDRVETGPRLVYGLDNRWGDVNRTDYRLFLGQSLRKFNDATLPASGGASTNSSDWVGQIEVTPKDWFSLSNKFRLDNATFIPRRLDTNFRLGYIKGANVQLTHSYLDGTTDELNTEISLPLTDTVKFTGRSRNNLANSKLLEGEAGFAWTRDCYRWELVARRKGFTNGDVQPSTDYMLNLQLLSLGSDG